MELHSPQPLDVKAAVTNAKAYVLDLLADEQISHLNLEETELERPTGVWRITVGFNRPWNTPRTRAQELLEQIGSQGGGRRAFKVIEVAPDGTVLSMKDRRD